MIETFSFTLQETAIIKGLPGYPSGIHQGGHAVTLCGVAPAEECWIKLWLETPCRRVSIKMAINYDHGGCYPLAPDGDFVRNAEVISAVFDMDAFIATGQHLELVSGFFAIPARAQATRIISRYNDRGAPFAAGEKIDMIFKPENPLRHLSHLYVATRTEKPVIMPLAGAAQIGFIPQMLGSP